MPHSPKRISIPIQTLYAELVDRAWTGNMAELMAAGGSPYARQVNGRTYWYWQPSSQGGPSRARYLGLDSDELRKRIQEDRDLAMIRKERLDLVRALRSARMPGPDGLTGNILAALSGAGAFRLRAVLVGSVAFQTYLPLLGFRVPALLSNTGDLDLGQFHSVALAIDDQIDADFLTVLRTVDPRFRSIPSPIDGRKVMRYAVTVGEQELYSVDVLCPLRGRVRGSVTELKALRGGAQIIKHLDFLLYREVNAVVLHGLGIPVNVPAPERYAVHKLIVSEMRIDTPRSQTKARKDLGQADALIRLLAVDRPHELEEAWREMRERGPRWRLKADRAIARLPADTQDIMEQMTARAPSP